MPYFYISLIQILVPGSMSSFASNVPMFGSHLQSVSGMAQKGINTFGAFGLGGNYFYP